MRPRPLHRLVAVSLLAATAALAQQNPTPHPSGTRFPNIQASLDDGFFVLAEQQARGILRGDPRQAAEDDAVLLLSHALWGQKRYSELLAMLASRDDRPGYLYWRARAFYELRRYDACLETIARAGGELAESGYHPAMLRLKGRAQQLAGRWADAEASYLDFAESFPEDVERTENMFDLAEVYALQGKIPEAIATYEGLREEPDAVVAQRARLKLAHLLYTRGAAENLGAARDLLANLANEEGARLAYRIDAHIDLAALEDKAGNRAAATAALRKAIALSPDARQRVPLKLSLARILMDEGDSTGALKLLEECRAEAPNETIAARLQLEKANALLLAKRFSEANEAYQIYIDVAAETENLSRAYFGKGLALWSMQRFAEAAATLDKALKGLGDPSERADALFKAGDAYYRAGDFEQAEERYRAFLDAFPEHENVPNALYQLGLSLAKNDDREGALSTFARIESEYAETPFAQQAALRSADVMRATEKWEDALGKYAQIVETYTNGAVAAQSIHQRGLVLYRLARFDDAQQAFETILSEYPQSEYVPQATYMRGFCLYVQGRREEAVETCRAFVRDYPDSEWAPEVVFWLAEQYYNQGDYKAAEPLFMRIASDFKGHRLVPSALYWAGRCAGEQDNYVEAIERFSEVAKSYADSEIMPQVRFAQGDALSELGEFSRAILAFEEIIKNYPENHLVNAAWGRKGDCQFALAVESPARYGEAMSSYQAILDRPTVPVDLKLQAEYKVGRCLEKTGVADKAFSRYMNVVYTFINENVERSPYTVLWFTRAAFGAATIKERAKDWTAAVEVYRRVIEAGVPAKDEAAKRIEKIKNENWLLFQEAEEKNYVGTGG